MIITSLTILATLAVLARAQSDISIYPITNVDETTHTGYFSDPFHVPFKNNEHVYLSGTTPKYLECDGSIQAGCASLHRNKYNTSESLQKAADDANAHICSAAGIHPYQSRSGDSISWHALVTLHVQDTPDCQNITGWSTIVHARPENESAVDEPPTSWIGDKVMIGSFSEDVRANYDGKYFKTPAGKLYLVYQKLYSDTPRRVGVAAWPMDDPETKTPGSKPTFLLLPDDGLNSENYGSRNNSFKLIETGNMRAINGKFLMAYSVGAFNLPTYKLAIAYSDTFLPKEGQQYRKVMKENPDHLWDSMGDKEVYYLLQSEQDHKGWHYVGDQVLAPGVPTVAKIGADKSWILTFAGYNPEDTSTTNIHAEKYSANHRRPYFIDLEVNIPANKSVKQATDAELQKWITPKHENSE